MYDFLLVRHYNYISILYHFRVIRRWMIYVTNNFQKKRCVFGFSQQWSIDRHYVSTTAGFKHCLPATAIRRRWQCNSCLVPLCHNASIRGNYQVVSTRDTGSAISPLINNLRFCLLSRIVTAATRTSRRQSAEISSHTSLELLVEWPPPYTTTTTTTTTTKCKEKTTKTRNQYASLPEGNAIPAGPLSDSDEILCCCGSPSPLC